MDEEVDLTYIFVAGPPRSSLRCKPTAAVFSSVISFIATRKIPVTLNITSPGYTLAPEVPLRGAGLVSAWSGSRRMKLRL